jgi:hypothetical protein
VPNAIAPGTVLHGSYRVIRPLGSGGMGVVYEASHLRLAGRYAVKLLNAATAGHPEGLERFRREAQVTSGLRDPAIVQVIDFNQLDDGTPYLVMEFVEGRELAAVIAEEAPLSPTRTAHLVQAIAGGLGAAHRCDVVHRDLKPQNVFVLGADGGRGQERVKILDFGISKMRSASTPQMTAESALLGTPQYMSPEQARGAVHEVDARTDQFALAVMAYEMLAGRPPFVAAGAATLLYKIVHEDPPPLAQLRLGLAPAVETVLRVALSKRREDRYPTIEDFGWELALATGLVAARPGGAAPGLAGQRVTGPSPPPGLAVGTTLSSSTAERQTAAPRRGWRRALLGAATVGILVAASVVALRRVRAPEPTPPPPAAERPARPSLTAAAVSLDAGAPSSPADAAIAAPPAPAEPAAADRVEAPARPKQRARIRRSGPPAPRETLVDEL